MKPLYAAVLILISIFVNQTFIDLGMQLYSSCIRAGFMNLLLMLWWIFPIMIIGHALYAKHSLSTPTEPKASSSQDDQTPTSPYNLRQNKTPNYRKMERSWVM